MGLFNTSNFIGARFFLSEWRDFDSIDSIEDFANRLINHPSFNSNCCLLAIPFSFLDILSKKIEHPHIILGANMMHSASERTFTASISGLVLKRHHAHFVLIGTAHSRKIHGSESLSFSNQIKTAIACGIAPFYCMGETLEQQQAGQSREILLEQCQQCFSELTPNEVSQLYIVYEAPWFKSTSENLSTDQLISHYSTFKQAVKESVDESLFQNLNFINALPLDLEEPEKLLAALPEKGFYGIEPEIFFSILNEKCAPLLKVKEEAPQESVSKTGISSLHPAEQISSTVNDTGDNVESLEPPLPLKEEEDLSYGTTEEEDAKDLESILDFDKEPQKNLKTKKQKDVIEETLEPASHSSSTASSVDQEFISHKASTSNEEHAYIPESVSQPDSLAALKEETSTIALPEKGSMHTLEEIFLELVPEGQETHHLQMKLQHLYLLDKSLDELYQQIQERMDTLPLLRKAFPDLLNSMTADLNKLDPILQEQINRGNIAFFTENPDMMKKAEGVLLQIQEINQLLQKTASIPREVDRILSKSREIRKTLETEWAYFRINRQQIKENYPDFSFPRAPSQLGIQEPATSLPSMDFGPSGLISKRIAVVKAPALPNQG